MICEKLFCEIEKLNDKYIGIWEDICNIESPTDFKEGIDKCGEYVVAWAKEMGFETELHPQSDAGDVVCITMNPNADKKPICISGHMDTVHPKGLFGYPPVSMDNEKIYGPGVSDCKGGIVAGMNAMEALKNCGFTSRTVMLLVQTDEEVGSKLSNKQTIDYICKKAENAEAFINLEKYNLGKCVVARKGILTLMFEINGIKAHSSACAESGANAIAEAAYKIIEMEKLKDNDGLTCNCGVISGGTVPNTVPDKCVFKANIRFASEKQYDWVMDYARKVAEETHVEGCTCKVSVCGSRPAMEKNERNYNLLDKMNRIYEENGMPVLDAFFARGGSDAAYITQCGIPCVDSVGVEGNDIHSEKEWAYLKSLSESAKRISSVIYCI